MRFAVFPLHLSKELRRSYEVLHLFPWMLNIHHNQQVVSTPMILGAPRFCWEMWTPYQNRDSQSFHIHSTDPSRHIEPCGLLRTQHGRDRRSSWRLPELLKHFETNASILREICDIFRLQGFDSKISRLNRLNEFSYWPTCWFLVHISGWSLGDSWWLFGFILGRCLSMAIDGTIELWYGSKFLHLQIGYDMILECEIMMVQALWKFSQPIRMDQGLLLACLMVMRYLLTVELWTWDVAAQRRYLANLPKGQEVSLNNMGT